MKQLTADQFSEYMRVPPETGDELVRKWAGVPEDRYYTVSVWPDHLAGRVFVTSLHRIVKTKKISKSDQH